MLRGQVLEMEGNLTKVEDDDEYGPHCSWRDGDIVGAQNILP